MKCPRCLSYTPMFSTRCPECTSEHGILELWGWNLVYAGAYLGIILGFYYGVYWLFIK